MMPWCGDDDAMMTVRSYGGNDAMTMKRCSIAPSLSCHCTIVIAVSRCLQENSVRCECCFLAIVENAAKMFQMLLFLSQYRPEKNLVNHTNDGGISSCIYLKI